MSENFQPITHPVRGAAPVSETMLLWARSSDPRRQIRQVDGNFACVCIQLVQRFIEIWLLSACQH